MSGAATGLVGREAELAEIRRFLRRPASLGTVLLLTGEPGTGKTALLAEAERIALSSGMRTLSAAGRESETHLAFAGLHQLLGPALLASSTELPGHLTDALHAAFGTGAGQTSYDALLLGHAVLAALVDLAGSWCLLVLVDDAQWWDLESLDVLAFVARRLPPESVALVVASRGAASPTLHDGGSSDLDVSPLSSEAAEALLDDQPRIPHGRAREQVLDQSQGNPLALIELSRALASDPAAARGWVAEPLPLSERLNRVLAARAADLPTRTRAALLLVAVADRPDLALRVPSLDVADLAPAEVAGLVEVDATGPRFRHPLVRASVYHSVSFDERARAHRLLSEALRDQPDRAAWHLAAATLEPDEVVAALLERTAAQTRQRGGAAAAARALERAAELTPVDSDRARRLLAAAGLAQSAGQADWVAALGTEILELTSDPELRLVARLLVGWAKVWSEQGGAALDTLLLVAEEAAADRSVLAWQALSLAATVAYQHGAEGEVIAVRRMLDRLPANTATALGDLGSSAAESRVWAEACTVAPSERAGVVADLLALPPQEVEGSAVAGAAAWLLDESELAVQVLRQYLTNEQSPETRGASGAALSALQWACIDTGRFEEALAASRSARDVADAYAMATVAASADLAAAYVNAVRGTPEEPARLVARALARADGTDYRSVAARARHALGTAAAGEGRVQDAYRELAGLFDLDGRALHHHVSYLGLADLAAAAARAGVREEMRPRLEPALAVAEVTSPRLRQLAARARGLLDPDVAGEHFAVGLSGATGDQWPFERALLRLDYGEWLRRGRQINKAKPVLSEALETFRRLRSEPWARRAEGELRASGVAVAAVPHDPLAGLTTQQREIVLLAGQGLTNAEIAERLYLSPRTVASHLYRSYPKLGVSGRHQLRDLTKDVASDQ